MSKGILYALGLALAITAFVPTARAERPAKPQPSPWQHVEQQVGAGFIEMEYSRPGVKGRKVYGTELVPYDGTLWRAGANERTSITFSTDVTVNGQPLKAGTYGLLVIATEKEWTWIFNKDFNSHGTENYDAKSDVLRVKSTPQAAEHAERLVYEFNDITDDGTVKIDLHWEKIRCGFEVKVSTPAAK
jgi:hypothetical protein